MNRAFLLLLALITCGVRADMSIAIPDEMKAAAQKAMDGKGKSLPQSDQENMVSMAKSIGDYANSNEFRQRQDALKAQVYNTAGFTPGQNDGASTENGPVLVSDQIVMFVSSSMPEQTLRNYARDLAKIGGVMVMRGTIGGISKMQPTIQLTHNVLRSDPTCEGAKCKMWGTDMLIDPVLFRIYNINQVPALIYQPNMHIQSYCDGLEKVNRASEVIYGDAKLSGMLTRLNQLSPDKKIQALIERLEKA